MSYKIRIGASVISINAFNHINDYFYNFHFASYKHLFYINALTSFLKTKNINFIEHKTNSWSGDELEFNSEEDYFLFLLEWS